MSKSIKRAHVQSIVTCATKDSPGKVDVGIVFNSIRQGLESLSPIDRADVLARLDEHRKSGVWRTDAVGDSLRKIRNNADMLTAINKGNAEYWKDK